MKRIIIFCVNPSLQVQSLILFSSSLYNRWPFTYPLSLVFDFLIFIVYNTECKTSSLKLKKLVLGHPLGVVMGGNGIACSGKLHLSSGVVFGRKYNDFSSTHPFFSINGNITVGANSVLLGPSTFEGDIYIGALTLLPPGHYTSGTYIGIPAKKL